MIAQRDIVAFTAEGAVVVLETCLKLVVCCSCVCFLFFRCLILSPLLDRPPVVRHCPFSCLIDHPLSGTVRSVVVFCQQLQCVCLVSVVLVYAVVVVAAAVFFVDALLWLDMFDSCLVCSCSLILRCSG